MTHTRHFTVATLLVLFCVVALGLHVYKIDALCLNEDEASHGYNTYSVMQTGKDEYGNLPLRYLAFGENKLPLAGMLSAPFIGLFGLDTWTVRMPTLVIGSLFPLVFYLATYALSGSTRISLAAAFFAATNVWLQVLSRHLHEAVVCACFVLLYIFVLFWYRPLRVRHMAMLALLAFFALYSYHSAKVVVPVLVLLSVWWQHVQPIGTHQQKRMEIGKFVVIILIALGAFFLTELAVPNNRITNLSYVTNPVFIHEIEVGRNSGGSPLIYNKLVYGIYQILARSWEYVSPAFLLHTSDGNPRFGASYVPLLTEVEYILFALGIVWMWYQSIRDRKQKWYIAVLILIAASILPASLAILTQSSTRSYLLVIGIVISSAVGLDMCARLIMRYTRSSFVTWACVFALLLTHLVFVTQNWSSYFDRYLSDPKTRLAWQCGAREASLFAWENRDKYDTIQMTYSFGQPYIYLLFYGGPYDPAQYQRVAKHMPYNQYGFWEQEAFDKYLFSNDLKCITGVKSLQVSLKRSDLAIQHGLSVVKPQSSSTPIYAYICNK